ncbi:MAG TPA: ABC transporter ATP-binding protein [Candidatus Ozemobacteraceae bacterium]|nr:ABC transporter ATP-binding protein [Candidatus Ozemobacteraceae bacterium]HQG28859.1 ABC transporter ATP-binding protein [Candidatus Ozemobacteraceae bacterium]
MPPILSVSDYSLTLHGSDGRPLPVLQSVNLEIARGCCVGVAGESGSGKSVLALSVMGLLPQSAVVARSGTIRFDDLDLLSLDEEAFRTIRGRRMAMVFQEPMTAMNPLMTLFDQVGETVQAHLPGATREEIRDRVMRSLQRAGFADPARFISSFPHQLSGGMRQRAMLAMALVMEPELVIADEPTTALDAALQIQLLGELRRQVRAGGSSMMFISHDLGVIRAVSDELVVMYAGVVVESGPTQDVMARPAHPYTAALIEALPRLIIEKRLPRPIAGHLPAPDRKPAGCVFSDRCSRVQENCRKALPGVTELGTGRRVRCLFPNG